MGLSFDEGYGRTEDQSYMQAHTILPLNARMHCRACVATCGIRR